MKLVMIGHGMVGHKFIEAILEKADDELKLRFLLKNLVCI
jgi:nitrite reductase (NADH) large subunit